MKIPKTLKVGIHTYKVELTKTNDEKKEPFNWGKTNNEQKKIYIENDVPESHKEEVFFHELLHTSMFEAKLGYDLDNKDKTVTEEDIVNRITPCLLRTLKENNFLK